MLLIIRIYTYKFLQTEDSFNMPSVWSLDAERVSRFLEALAGTVMRHEDCLELLLSEMIFVLHGNCSVYSTTANRDLGCIQLANIESVPALKLEYISLCNNVKPLIIFYTFNTNVSI